MLEAQRNAEVLQKVLKWKDESSELPEKFKPYKQKLFLVEGLLTYEHHGKKLVVAPEIFKAQILVVSHNHFSSGHFGEFKTHRRLLETFW